MNLQKKKKKKRINTLMDDSIDVIQDNQSVKYRRTFFDGYIWTFYRDLIHNSHKEKK